MKTTRKSTFLAIGLAIFWLSPVLIQAREHQAGTVAQQTKASDPWAPCRFMMGEWVGTQGSGQPGEAIAGGFTLAYDLGDKVLVRKSFADYAPKPGEKTGISHHDLMIIYALAGETQLRAFYVDDEGHAINYLVSSPKENVAAFETDAAERGPRFRLDYQLNPDHTLSIAFSIAPPGGSYKVYTKGTAHRK